MSKHCRFCGGKILADAVDCKHCGKTLVKKPEPDEKLGISNINSWKGKTVPSWVMYLVLAFALFWLVLFVMQGMNAPPAPELPPAEEPIAFHFTQSAHWLFS